MSKIEGKELGEWLNEMLDTDLFISSVYVDNEIYFILGSKYRLSDMFEMNNSYCYRLNGDPFDYNKYLELTKKSAIKGLVFSDTNLDMDFFKCAIDYIKKNK